MSGSLTFGALANIFQDEDVVDPILQVLGHKPINGTRQERYRLLLSDGHYSTNLSMLATQLNNLIHDKQLEQFTLIKVKKHICNSVPGQSKRVVIILELEIVTPGSQIGSKIGSPQLIGADGADGELMVNFGSNWYCSSELEKLYIDKNKWGQVEFRVMTNAPSNLFLRVYCIYSFSLEAVKRCPTHASVNDEPPQLTEHLILGDGDQCRYECDDSSGRLSVIFPVEQPHEGTYRTRERIKFMCLSTCVGGINRRPLKVIFTLETDQGKEVGKKVFDVKICGNPWRAKAQEEDRHRHQKTEDRAAQQFNIERAKKNESGGGINSLHLAVEGPSKADITCNDNKDGTVDVSYLPTAPGEYKITAMRMREAVPVTEIGSQCRLTFKMPGIYVEDLEATVTSPSGKSTKANVSEEEEGLYAVNFVPHELGIHTVTVRYRDVDIPGSPFQFTVGPLQDSGAHRVHAGNDICLIGFLGMERITKKKTQSHRSPVSIVELVFYAPRRYPLTC